MGKDASQIDSSSELVQGSPTKVQTLESASFTNTEQQRRENYNAYLDLKRQLTEAKQAIEHFDTQHPPLKSPLLDEN